MLIRCVVEASGRDFRGKPVGFREAECEGNEVLFDLLLAELLANLVERLDGLAVLAFLSSEVPMVSN